MQTWRAEYKGGDASVPAVAASNKKVVVSRSQETVKGPPKLEFQQESYKWLVEFQSGQAEVNIGDKRETVSMAGCKFLPSLPSPSCNESAYVYIICGAGLHLRLCGRHGDSEWQVQEHQRGLLQENQSRLRSCHGLLRDSKLAAN